MSRLDRNFRRKLVKALRRECGFDGSISDELVLRMTDGTMIRAMIEAQIVLRRLVWMNIRGAVRELLKSEKKD